MQTVDLAIHSHISKLPQQLNDFLHTEFRQNHVVKLNTLLPADLGEEMGQQSKKLIDHSAKRRDMDIAITGGTPRAYLSVDRDTIRKDNGIITHFFQSEVIRKYLSTIAGEDMFRVPYAPEEYIVNSQQKSGDTHGWHFDDYTYALIWVAEAPSLFDGGRVELIADTVWDKEAPKEQIENLLKTREIRSLYVQPGTCYLMRARYCLHRVAPLLGKTRRTVIVFTYASQSDLNDTSISHETMEQIYSPELQVA